MKKLSYALLAVLFGITATFAQPMQKANGCGGMQQMIKNKLNLTDQQAKKFDNIIYNQKEKAIDTRAEMQKLKLKINKMMNENSVTEGKLTSLTNKMFDLRTKMSKSRIDSWYKIYNILDKNQQQVWTKMFKRFMKHGKKGNMMGMKKGMMKNRMQNRNNVPNKPMMNGGMMNGRMMK